MTRRILAVSNNFPTPHFAEKGVFVANILREMARQGAAVDVIAPYSWIAECKHWRKPRTKLDFGPLQVKQPVYTAVPLRWPRHDRLLTGINSRLLRRAVESQLSETRYDVAYAHFFPSALAIMPSMEKARVPVFLNFGESDPWDYDQLYGEDWIGVLRRLQGIVTVSRANFEYLSLRDPQLIPRMRWIPNGVDTHKFHPISRSECRARLGLPPTAHIAAFCGHFDHRKGPMRVAEAVRLLGIKAVFLGGNGRQVPHGPGVLHAGSVIHDELPLWLNAADVFVLPSLSEGMSNAVLEALACGLPLVVADRPFNRDFLVPECAEFVDPLDTAAIAEAISRCLVPAAASMMAAAGVALARRFSLEARITRMFEYFDGAAAS